MIAFARCHGGVFQFDKVTDMNVFTDLGPGSETCVGSNQRALRYLGPFDVAERPNLNIILNLDARAEHDVWTHDPSVPKIVSCEK